MTAETTALPPVVTADEWRRELDALRVREKAATRELDAIAAQRRRLPMVELPPYRLTGPEGEVSLAGGVLSVTTRTSSPTTFLSLLGVGRLEATGSASGELRRARR